MKHSLPATLTLVLLAAIFLAPVIAAQTVDPTVPDSAEGEDDAPIQRVARITFIEGDVSFLRAGVNEWATVAENLPLFTGDQIYTGKGAPAEGWPRGQDCFRGDSNLHGQCEHAPL